MRLLAWRLDIAHVDPLSQVVDTSAGNAKFNAGKVVTLRAISGHRDTGPTECPGNEHLRAAPALAKRVAATGLPKLYSVAAARRARRPDPLPGPALLGAAVDGDRDRPRPGKVVARGSGRSTLVDWTWSSAKAGKGPFRWRIDAGANVFPAQGTLGGPFPCRAEPRRPPRR